MEGLIRSLLGLCSLSVLFNALGAVGLAEHLIDRNSMPVDFSSGDQGSSDDGDGCLCGLTMRIISVDIVQLGEDGNCYFLRRMFILTMGFLVVRIIL